MNVIRLMSCLLLPILPLSSMERNQSKEEKKFEKIKSWIVNPSDQVVKKWPRFFRKVDSLSDEKKIDLKKILEIQNNPYLMYLSNYHDNIELEKARAPYNEGTRIVTKESSTVLSLPFLPQKIALNDTGTALAVSYGTTFKIITKKNHWGAESLERTDRCPVEGMAFIDQNNFAVSTELHQYSLNLQTKDQKSYSTGDVTPYKKPLISHNGKWLMYYSNQQDYSLCFENLESNHVFGISIADEAFQDLRFTSFAADKNGENFALTSPLGFVMAHLSIREQTDFKIIYNHLNQYTQPFVDCDMRLDGQKAVCVGQNIMHVYHRNDSDELESSKIPFSTELYASRFHPLDDSVILATADGVELYDVASNARLKVLENPVKLISVSGDGLTLAAANPYAIFLINILHVRNQMSLEEHLLIKRLTVDHPEQVLPEETFMKIFKAIENDSLKQRIIKAFKIDLTKHGYTHCFICSENFSNIKLSCAHTFCSDCIEQWESEGKNTCPTCRTQINTKKRKK